MHYLYPILFKKDRINAKAKGVDIQLTVDVLSHVYQDNVDIICFFSGDGDYLPVLEEAQHSGKQVFVAAFSNGLNPKLKQKADYFNSLDDIFFDMSKAPNKKIKP